MAGLSCARRTSLQESVERFTSGFVPELSQTMPSTC